MSDEKKYNVLVLGFGEILAVAISWSLHKSIIWAIIHGLLGWFYVVYYIFTR
jgi:hypothetical protein